MAESVPRKIDNWYEAKLVMGYLPRKALSAAKGLFQRINPKATLVENLIDEIRRINPKKVQHERPPRNYQSEQLAKAKALYPSYYIDTIKGLGIGGNDDVILAYLRGLAVALSTDRPADFDSMYSQMLTDERLRDSERDMIASAVLDMQARELTFQ